MTGKAAPALRDNPIVLTQRLALALQARCRQAFKDAGLDDVNLAQLALLTAIEGDDGLSATALAQVASYEKSTLTPLLDRLEASQLILRARDPGDRRVQRLFITKTGRRRRREADEVLAAVTREVFGAVTRKALQQHAAFCAAVLEPPEKAPAKPPAKTATKPTPKAPSRAPTRATKAPATKPPTPTPRSRRR